MHNGEKAAPADRFWTWGPVWRGNHFAASSAGVQDSEGIQGLAAYLRIVEGRVRCIQDPNTELLQQGEILVCYRTDPDGSLFFQRLLPFWWSVALCSLIRPLWLESWAFQPSSPFQSDGTASNGTVGSSRCGSGQCRGIGQIGDADLSILDGRLGYAQCWEDISMLRKALAVQAGERVLSICSAGDNSFGFCLDKAAEVVCIDLSQPQLALAELKWLGLQELRQSGLLTLLGLNAAGRRVFLYHQLRKGLSESARQWWDGNEGLIREGLLDSGRFEQYLGLFRTRILPLIHRRKPWILLTLDDLDAQRQFYAKRWNNLRWQGLFRVFFSQRVMAARGRSPEQFAHVEGPVSAAILGRAKHALTEIPVQAIPT